jgi:hypothetical protein
LHPTKNLIKVFCAFAFNAFWTSLLFWGNLVFAQQICDQPLTEIPLHIQADERGWVFDYQARLQWQRCAIGQTWVEQQCVGKAEAMTYFQAVRTVTELNRQSLDGFNDWKLPHLKDLAFIAEKHCRNPRVRLEWFPNFPPGVFWSRYTRIVNDFDPHVFTMDFGFSGVSLNHPEESHFVRLVRKLH